MYNHLVAENFQLLLCFEIFTVIFQALRNKGYLRGMFLESKSLHLYFWDV